MGVNNSTRYMGINVFLLGGWRCNPLNILWNTRLIFFSIIYLRAFLFSLLAEHCCIAKAEGRGLGGGEGC